MLSDYPTRVKLEDQEGRFVLGTLAYAPVAQLGASLRNWARQMAMVFVDDPVRDPAFYLTDPYWRQTNLPPMIARVEDCGPRHNLCRSRLTVAASKLWHGAVAVIAAAVALAALLWPRRRGARGRPAGWSRRRCSWSRRSSSTPRFAASCRGRSRAIRRGSSGWCRSSRCSSSPAQGNKTRENRPTAA